MAQLSHGIVGHATLQLLARDPQGMPESLLGQVRRIDGVRAAAPLLEASAEATGPRASVSVELVGADSSLRKLGGALVRHTELEPFAEIGAVLLPGPLATHLGVTKFGREVTLQMYGRTERAPLYEQLHEKQIGSLAASPIVVAPLFFAQEMTGLTGRISRILVQPARGRQAVVRAELVRLAAGRLNVESTSYDEKLFAKAASASNQSTALFALISALVGFLFAFNAMLLTVPQRRRLIAELRRDGYTPRTVIAVLLLDAVALGVVACLLGLALGEELSIHLFGSNPGYLGSAFAVGTQRVVGWRSVVIAVGGGMLAALAAVLSPLRDVLSRDPLAAITPKERFATGRTTIWAALAGVLCLAGTSAILLGAPKLANVGMILLVAALLLVLPAALNASLALLTRLARTITGATAHVAAMELTAARARAVAVAATGAIAVFGAVAIQGAHADLLKGLENAARDENAFTDVWVSPPGAYNLLRTAPFVPTQQRTLERIPGVRAVRVYRGGLLDWGRRRVWVIAPPDQATPLLPASQLVEGSLAQATAHVRAGGWAVFAQALAQEHHLHIGERVALPTPVPSSVRVAALSTNVGWVAGPPGIGPGVVRASMTLLNGLKERSHVETQAYAGAGCQEAEGGRQASRRGTGVAGGDQAVGGVRTNVLPVAQPVRRDEGRGREAIEGAGGGEREVEADRGRPGAGYPGAQGAVAGKLLSPARRRRAVAALQGRLGFSERRACRLAGQHRSTQRHEPAVAVDDAAIRAQLHAFSRKRPRWGYRQAHQHLLQEGWSINRKRVQRLWREEGLRVPQKRRKRQRRGESTVPGDRLRAQRPDHVWAFDFQFDVTEDGRAVKLLYVVDEFTREALAMEAERRIDGDRVVDVLEGIVAEQGRRPELVRCDNGPEMTSNALRDWCRFSRTGAAFIEPGSPWENPFVESFNSRVRDELLSVEVFSCLTEAKVMIEDFRQDYNRYRPHRAHRMMTPTAFRTGWETVHEAALASAELRRRYAPAPSDAGGSPTLQEPTNHQLSQQVDR